MTASIVFALDGRLLVSASEDGRLRLMDVRHCTDGAQSCGHLL